MDIRQATGERSSYQSAIEDTGFSETITVPDVLLSLAELNRARINSREFERNKIMHVSSLDTILTADIDDYVSKVSIGGLSTAERDYLKERFDKKIANAARIRLSSNDLAGLSIGIIDRSLSKDAMLTPEIRRATVDMALAIGKGTIDDIKVAYLDRKLKEIVNENVGIDQQDRINTARHMLGELGYDTAIKDAPSSLESITNYAKVHVPALGVVVTAAVVAGTIFTSSSAANASEPVPPNVLTVQSPNSQNKEIAVPPAPSTAMPNSAPKQISISSPNVPIIPKNPELVTVKLAVGASVNVAPHQISVAPSVGNNSPEVTQTVTVEPSVETPAPTPKTSDQSSTIPDKNNVINTPISLAPELSPVLTSPNHEQLSPEQIALQSIKQQINNNNIDMAAAQIILAFHTGVQTSTGVENGNAVYPMTNAALFANIKTLEASNTAVMARTGHLDVNYVNNILSALTVLHAVSTDQSVLQTSDTIPKPSEVVSLLANIQRPTDPYMARVFDAFLTTSKATLGANNGALLAGMTTMTADRLEEVYAYILMAQTTDSEQAVQVQLLKDADAKAAVEKAAADKAAAEKAATEKAAVDKAAADAAVETSVSPKQTLLTAINQAAAKFGWSNDKTILLTVAAQNDVSVAAIAGLGGNVFAESGFNPGKAERGSGIGFGYIQESYGRRSTMEAAARAEGVNVADPTWQANYVIRESKQRTQRNHSNKNEWAEFITLTDPIAAADYWLYNNERAGVPHSATREAMASEIYNQINDQVNSIQAAQAAAAEKAKEAAVAESERHAKMGMNLAEAVAFMDSYKNTPDNIQYIGESGTTCNGGPLSNCVSFSVYFANKFTTIKDMGKGFLPGMGGTVVKTILSRNPSVESGHDARVDAIFSTPHGSQNCENIKCGHTGVILGVDVARGKVIVGEAGCAAAAKWDTAREYDLKDFNSGAYTYAYTNNILKTEVK